MWVKVVMAEAKWLGVWGRECNIVERSAWRVVSTGKRQVDWLMVLGGCTHSLVTSGDSTGLEPVCAPIQNQEPVRTCDW